MKTFLLILCMMSLFSKIKGFKNLFKKPSKIQEEFEVTMSKLKDMASNESDFETTKGAMLVIYWICGIYALLFYIISMFYISQIYVIVLGCIMLILNIKGYYKGSLIIVGKEKFKKNDFLYSIFSYTYLGIIFYNLYINW